MQIRLRFSFGFTFGRITTAAALLSVAAATCSARFTESEIDFGVPVDMYAALAGDEYSDGYIIVSGELPNGGKHLSLFGIEAGGTVRGQPDVRLALDSRHVFFDTARIGGRDALLIGGTGGIWRVDTDSGELRLLARLPSLFRTGSEQPLEHLDFAFDIDADGRDDLVLQDFDGIRVSLQTETGFAEPQLLGLEPEFRYADSLAQFRPVEVLSFDFNADGRPDVAALRDGEFQVFEATGGATAFAADPRTLRIDIDVTDERTLRRFDSDMLSLDQSDLQLTRIDRVVDLNGDDLPDIVTHTTLSDGVFDKRTQYRVYFARTDERGVYYRREQDSTIASNGFQIGLQIVADTIGNRSDIVTTSVDFGFRELITALFTRSLTLDIGLHRLIGNDAYPAEPGFLSQARVRFDVSTGFISTPAIRFADFDGDGRIDLLTQTDESTLSFQSRVGSNDRARPAAFQWATTLPRDGNLVETGDVNGDARADIVIRYGSGDAEGLRNTLRVLVSAAPSPAGD